MKFKLLSIGQKLEYQGEVYVKTSSIIASNVETNHNKMIPAYATLNLLSQSIAEKEIKTQENLNTEQIISAFNDFYADCITLVENKTALELARDKFMQNIIKTPD